MDETPKGELAKHLKGDLAVARRHLARLRLGLMPPATIQRIYEEIEQSIDRCVARIERDVRPLEQQQSLHNQPD